MKGINLGEPPIVLGEKKLRVELDKKALFALASDTRLEILKALQSERRTVSQLAETLGVDKAAVYRHLKKLEEGDFVKREDDHGFVYYRLSWKAQGHHLPRGEHPHHRADIRLGSAPHGGGLDSLRHVQFGGCPILRTAGGR